jgi:hypothetical protein
MIACLVRLKQIATLGEVLFITSLASYQLVISFTSTTSYLVVQSLARVRLVVLAMYSMASFIMFFLIIFIADFPKADIRILQKITEFCVLERDYPFPVGIMQEESNTAKVDAKFHMIYWPSLFGSIVILAIMAIFFDTQIRRIVDRIRYYYVGFCTWAGVDPKRFFTALVIIAFTAFWLPFIALSMLTFQMQRRRLQSVSGASYQDSQWGFGQITAILLWAPLAHDIGLAIIGNDTSH